MDIEKDRLKNIEKIQKEEDQKRIQEEFKFQTEKKLYGLSK